MAGQREDRGPVFGGDASEIVEAFKSAWSARRTGALWSDIAACLENIRMAEFYLGYLPEKPNTDGIDHEAIQVQLQDARRLLGSIALDLTEGSDS